MLRSVSPTTEDLEALAAIALQAKERGDETEVVAEQIRTSIPRLRPVADWLVSQQGVGMATWITVLLTLLALIVTIKSATSTTQAPISHQTIVIECPSGEEQEISRLLEQINDELRSEWKSGDTIDGPGGEFTERHS